MDLPTLDFSKYLHGSAAEQRKLGEDLVDSFKSHGFVKLINHGIPEQTVHQYQAFTKQLFDLPLEEKQSFANIFGPHPQRGWSCKGSEGTGKLRKENWKLSHNNGKDLIDEREHFDAGPPEESQYPNKWPVNSIPQFKPVMEECYLLLQRSSLQIMSAIEVGLNLTPGTLVERCMPNASEIRLNHYPPVDIEVLRTSNTKRTWPHTDFGIITLLFQDQIGGLELENRRKPGTFVPVVPGAPDKPTELVVNLSDTIERWTNGVLRAGLHRVDVPSSMKNRRAGTCPDRYSSIFFLKAGRETSVGPLPAFVNKERPAKFDDVTALQFQSRMTKILY